MIAIQTSCLRPWQTRIIPWETGGWGLLDRLCTHEQMLCIVNSRAQAQALHQALGGGPGAYHLST